MGDNTGTKPLVLENDKLYLQRYWSYECQLAKKLVTIICTEHQTGSLSDIIERYFPVSNETNWQKEAAKSAVKDSFCIVTGGPGTGKTTTVVKILALLQELSTRQLN